MKRVIKSVFSVLLMIIILLSSIVAVSAQNIVLTGKPNYGFTCELDTSTGVLTIGGLGMLFAGDVESALNTNDLSIVKEIVIKEGISLIHLNGWFNEPDFSNVEIITIPKTMKRIAKDTFVNCTSIKQINYGGSKEEWKVVKLDAGNGALKNANVKYNCDVAVTDGADSFNYSMNIEKTNKSYKAVLDCYSGVVTVSPKENSSKSVSIGEDLISNFSIETKWFDGYCPDYMATSLVLENGITEIGTDAFINSYFESITIPKTLKKIGKESFGDSNSFEKSKLADVYYEGSISDWKGINMGVNNIPLMIAQKHYGVRVSDKELTYTLSKKNFVFNGKSQYPKVTVKDKNGNALEYGEDFYLVYNNAESCQTGKYKVVIKLMGEYKGQKTLYYYIKAKAPVVLKVARRDKGFTVTWNKLNKKANGDISRYEVQYSTSSSFKNSKTIVMKNPNSYAKRVSGLKKGKRYYVRVRSLTKVSGGYIRSAWSNTKSVKAG